MNSKNKKAIIGLSTAFLMMMLVFFITEAAFIYQKYKTVNPISIQEIIKSKEESEKKVVSEKNKNPNDCLFSGCGNFY